jgi:hypothetical protein
MILSMHARMAECVDTQDARGVEEARKPVPMPAASLGNCRSAGLRTLELKQLPFRRIAFPSFLAQWQLMRLGSITVAGAVPELPSWRLTSFP